MMDKIKITKEAMIAEGMSRGKIASFHTFCIASIIILLFPIACCSGNSTALWISAIAFAVLSTYFCLQTYYLTRKMLRQVKYLQEDNFVIVQDVALKERYKSPAYAVYTGNKQKKDEFFSVYPMTTHEIDESLVEFLID